MDREYWIKQLKRAERELDAATRLTDVNAAAKRLMLAKTQLKALEAKPARSWSPDLNHLATRKGAGRTADPPLRISLAFGRRRW